MIIKSHPFWYVISRSLSLLVFDDHLGRESWEIHSVALLRHKWNYLSPSLLLEETPSLIGFSSVVELTVHQTSHLNRESLDAGFSFVALIMTKPLVSPATHTLRWKRPWRMLLVMNTTRSPLAAGLQCLKISSDSHDGSFLSSIPMQLIRHSFFVWEVQSTDHKIWNLIHQWQFEPRGSIGPEAGGPVSCRCGPAGASRPGGRRCPRVAVTAAHFGSVHCCHHDTCHPTA